MRLLFIGDIVGKPGREAVAAVVPKLRADRGIDFVIANGENAAAGAGITSIIAGTLLESGVDAITLGDHVWDQKGFEKDIADLKQVCRPANLPEGNPGRDHLVVEKNGFRLLLFTVLGRSFMGLKAECPFRASDRLLKKLEGQYDGALVEMHAEATSEKQALGWHLAGRAMAVLGTHTHVATADTAILRGRTAFQCDAGMTGPHESVLGRGIEPVLGRFLDGLPRRFEVATGDVRLSATLVEFSAEGRATGIEWLSVKHPA
jgi:hypothetical protein